MKLDTILRKVTIITLVILGVIVLGVGLLFNIGLSPEKVTPAVVKELNKKFNVTVDCESVELTFFSTFPNVGARISNAYIKTLNTGEAKDTLASFHSALVSFDLFQYVLNKNIAIKKFRVERPYIHVYVGKNGVTNMNIHKKKAITNVVFLDKNPIKIKNINIKKLEIIGAKLVYEDEITDLIYTVDSFSVKMNAKVKEDQILFRILSQNKNIKVFSKEKRIYELNRIGADFAMDYNRESGEYRLKSKDITVNDIHFSTNGLLIPDKYDRTIKIQVQSRLISNSINQYLSVIPERFLPKKNRVVNGEVLLNASIDGIYGKRSLPNVKYEFNINNGYLAYSDSPGEIRTLEAKMRGQYNPDSVQSSYLYIDKLKIVGTGINIAGDIKRQGQKEKSFVKANLMGNVDLSKIAEDFPLDPSLKIEGKVEMDFLSEFHPKQFHKERFSARKLEGNVNFDHVVIVSKIDSFNFSSDKLSIRSNNDLNEKSEMLAELKIKKLQLAYKNNFSFQGDEIEAIARVQLLNNLQYTVNTTAYVHNAEGGSISDSTAFILKKANIHGIFNSQANNGSPQFTSDFFIDSIGFANGTRKVVMQQVSYNLKIDKIQKGKWNTTGNVNFKSLIGIVPEVIKPVILVSTSLSFKNDNFVVDNGNLIYGDIDVSFSGNLEHAKGLLTGNLVKADLKTNSEYVNANELLTLFFGRTKEKINTNNSFREVNRPDATIGVVSKINTQ